MPQEMNVLCCYSCKMYQVHIVKKARKWQCKLCNAKQSIQKIYFQGSGQECRLHVQQLNYLKANDTFSLQEDSSYSGCNVTNIAQESGTDKAVKSEWAKYLDSPKKESPSDAEDLSSDDIRETENITNEKLLYNAINNDSCNFENTVDNHNFGCEVIIDETEKEKLCSTSFNYNSNIEHKCNLQDNGKSSRDHNNAVNIFETYSELDDPLDI